MQVLYNGRLITRDPLQPYFEKGAVAFEGTKIVEVEIGRASCRERV